MIVNRLNMLIEPEDWSFLNEEPVNKACDLFNNVYLSFA